MSGSEEELVSIEVDSYRDREGNLNTRRQRQEILTPAGKVVMDLGADLLQREDTQLQLALHGTDDVSPRDVANEEASVDALCLGNPRAITLLGEAPEVGIEFGGREWPRRSMFTRRSTSRSARPTAVCSKAVSGRC